MSGALDPSLRLLSDCDCCSGVTAGTPAEVVNRPGLTAIAYRVGRHALFKQSLLARLSGSDLPALRGLTTREDDDFSVALLDAWATVADVLTFYQERIANESYLRTAVERASLLHLSRLIGYELRSGVAASTYLAFTLEEAKAPGVPRQTTISIGTAVQSIPGPGEQPQTFETIEQIEARPEWNALRPRTTELVIPVAGDRQVYLKGVATNLKAGDGLLLIGAEREQNATGDHWDFRLIESVTVDRTADRTLVKWNEGLGSPFAAPAATPKVYAFRQRAALFGANAPDWRTMPDSVRINYGDIKSAEWPNFNLAYAASVPAGLDTIYLDAVYPKVVQGSWVVLTSPAYVEVYRVETAIDDARSEFTLSGKSARLKLSGENLAEKFGNRLRDAVVFGESEPLQYAEQPLRRSGLISLGDGALAPIEGNRCILADAASELVVGQRVLVSGKPMRVEIVGKVEAADIRPDEGIVAFSVKTGDSLQILDAPVKDPDGRVQLHLIDQNGATGFVTTSVRDLLLQPAREKDAAISEAVAIKSINAAGTGLTFNPGLRGSYDRATVVIYGNVAPATHGESKQEVLGSGDASQAFQQFTLKQPPLTYVASTSPSGAESTLSVRVNDLLWHEVPTFYGRGPRDRIFVTRTGDDGKTAVEFGDGKTGARLPTGRENVTARYRKGIGVGGNLAAEKLSLLMSRPLGVKSALNPVPAGGAADPEARDDARRNAPFTVLTLDRVVSLQDYEDFARAFSGVAKALATWTWSGQVRGVFVTVAGVEGAAIVEGSTTHANLIASMKAAGDPYIPLRVQTYRRAFFKLGANVKCDPDYEAAKVMAAVEAAVRAEFSFVTRAFGQAVSLGEIVAVMQNVAGVLAVDLTRLYRADDPAGTGTRDLLLAAAPQAGAGALPGPEDDLVSPAELLTLHPGPLEELGALT